MEPERSDIVEIFVSSVNSPEFIFLQYFLIKRFMKEPFRINVLNDAKNYPHRTNLFTNGMRDRIRRSTMSLGLNCIDIPESIHSNRNLVYSHPISRDRSASTRTANVIDFAVKYYAIPSGRRVLFLDSDVFPFDHFSFSDLLDDAHAFGDIHERTRKGRSWMKIRYIWNAFFGFDSATLPNTDWFVFDNGRVNFLGYRKRLFGFLTVNGDTGAALHYYLKRTPEFRFRQIHRKARGTWDRNDAAILNINVVNFLEQDYHSVEGKYIAEVYEDKFLHMMSGGNWRIEDSSNPGLNITTLPQVSVKETGLYERQSSLINKLSLLIDSADQKLVMDELSASLDAKIDRPMREVNSYGWRKE